MEFVHDISHSLLILGFAYKASSGIAEPFGSVNKRSFNPANRTVRTEGKYTKVLIVRTYKSTK